MFTLLLLEQLNRWYLLLQVYARMREHEIDIKLEGSSAFIWNIDPEVWHRLEKFVSYAEGHHDQCTLLMHHFASETS